MMNENLCFNIETINLYLEQILVEYIDIPIFFLCKGDEQYYIALCTDVDELNYIVAKISLLDVYNLLHGKTPMRDVILKQDSYWNVVSGDEIYLDIITKKNMAEIETTLLPERDACFKILTKQAELFVQKFDREFLDEKLFCESNKRVDFSEQYSGFSCEVLYENISQFTELADYKVQKPISLKKISYCENMNSIDIKNIKLNSEQSIQKYEMFRITGLCGNNIVIAA